jgi:hypothetical protein
MLGSMFFAANVLMFPLAYLYSIAKKLYIICKQNDTSERMQLIGDFMMFIFCGPWFLVFSHVTDLVGFFKHIFQWKLNSLSAEKIEIIEASTFVIIERTIHECMAEIKKFEAKTKEAKKKNVLKEKPEMFIEGGLMKTKSFVLRVRNLLEISNQLNYLIYDNKVESIS